MKKRTAIGDRLANSTSANDINPMRSSRATEAEAKSWREEHLRQRALELAIDALATGRMAAETTVVHIATNFYNFLKGEGK